MEDPERKRQRERERYASLTTEERRAKGAASNARVKAKLARVKKLEAENFVLKQAARERYHDKYGGQPLLDFVPFRMWLIQKQREHGTTALASMFGWDDARIRRYLRGYDWEQKTNRPSLCGPSPIVSVTIDIVDHCLTCEGSTTLGDLYPHIPEWDDVRR